MTDGPR